MNKTKPKVRIKCLRCPKQAFSISVGFGKEVGYCKDCAEFILASAMLMDVQKKSFKIASTLPKPSNKKTK